MASCEDTTTPASPSPIHDRLRGMAYSLHIVGAGSGVKGERCGQVYDGRPRGVTASPAVPWARRFTTPSPGEHLRPHRAGARHQRPAREPARAVVEAARAAGGGAALARPGAAAGPAPPRRLAPRRAPAPCAPTGPSPRKAAVAPWMRRSGADASAQPAVPVAYQ